SAPGHSHTFTVADAADTLNSIQGNLILHGQGTPNDFTIFSDALNTASGLSYTLTGTTFDRTGMAIISFDGLADTDVDVANGVGNQLNVQSLAPGVSAFLFAGSGDTVTLGQPTANGGHTLQTLLGPVFVEPTDPADPNPTGPRVIVDDSGNTSTAARTIT